MKKLDVKALLERVASASVKTKVITGVVAASVVAGTVGGVAYVNRDTAEPSAEVVETAKEDAVTEEVVFTDTDGVMYAVRGGVVYDNTTDKNVIREFEKDELIPVTGEADAWYRVMLEGKTGVIRKSYLTAEAPVVEEEEVEETASTDTSTKSSTAKADTKKSTSSNTTSSNTSSSKSKTTTTSKPSGNVDNAPATTDPSVETQPSTPSTPDTPSTPSAPTAEEQAQIAAHDAAMADLDEMAARQQAEAEAAREALLAEHPELAGDFAP